MPYIHTLHLQSLWHKYARVTKWGICQKYKAARRIIAASESSPADGCPPKFMNQKVNLMRQTYNTNPKKNQLMTISLNSMASTGDNET